MLIPPGSLSSSSASAAGARPSDERGDAGVLAGASVSVPWAASGCGNGVVVLKQAEGTAKMEKEWRRCSSADEALRVSAAAAPLLRRRRRGDGSGSGSGGRLDRMATAATTALATRNHSALELSHAGSSDGHHHGVAMVCGRGRPPTGSRARFSSRAVGCGLWLCWLCLEFPKLCAPS